MIDATHHEVGLSGHEDIECQFKAIGGCSVALIDGEPLLLAQTFHVERAERRYAAPRTAARTIGSHHYDVAQVAHQLRQNSNALRLHPVVVRDEN